MLKFFSSMKVGLGLIVALAFASIIATLEPQSSVYSSFWYRGLLLLLCLNLFVCTMRRLPQLFKVLNKDYSEEYVDSLKITQGKRSNHSEKHFEKLKDNLGEKGFKVKVIAGSQKSLLFANKGKLDLVAPHLVHISMLIIVIGALIGNFGAKDYLRCYIGETVRMPTSISENMTFKLEDFQTIYDERNAIDNWRSDFILFNKGQEVAQASTKVNAPFKYEGIKFYQSGYGYTHNVKLNMGGQEKEISFAHNKPVQLTSSLYLLFTDENNKYILEKYENGNLLETLPLEEEKEYTLLDDFKLTYLNTSPYSVIKVKTDPGLPTVMVGFLLMTVGFMLSWLGRYQEVRILYDRGKNVLDITTHCKSKPQKESLQAELNSLIKEGV